MGTSALCAELTQEPSPDTHLPLRTDLWNTSSCSLNACLSCSGLECTSLSTLYGNVFHVSQVTTTTENSQAHFRKKFDIDSDGF